MHENAVSLRVIGFVLSLILTLAAYFLIIHPEWFSLTNEVAIKVIIGLALIQATVQIFFFLDLWREKGPLWNLSVFISTISIIALIIAFSIWIIADLDMRMM